jgi:hypothetical protein
VSVVSSISERAGFFRQLCKPFILPPDQTSFVDTQESEVSLKGQTGVGKGQAKGDTLSGAIEVFKLRTIG